MTREDAKPAMERSKTRLSGISEEWAEWMAHRSAEIYRVTQTKGSPGYSWSYPKPTKKP